MIYIICLWIGKRFNEIISSRVIGDIFLKAGEEKRFASISYKTRVKNVCRITIQNIIRTIIISF